MSPKKAKLQKLLGELFEKDRLIEQLTESRKVGDTWTEEEIELIEARYDLKQQVNLLKRDDDYI